MPDPLPWDQISNPRALQSGNTNPLIVVGAGLAGCWLARTLAESGVKVLVLDACTRVASGGSSNPVGLFKPYVTRSNSYPMQFYLEAYRCLQHRLHNWGLVGTSNYTSCGLLQLVETPYPPSPHYQSIAPSETTRQAGSDLDANALLFDCAGWLNPAALCRALLEHMNIEVRCEQRIVDISAVSDHQWKVSIDRQTELIAEHIVLGTGATNTGFDVTTALTTIPARGQLSRFSLAKGTSKLNQVVNGKSYVIPDGDSIIVGATFERGVNDASLSELDNTLNLKGLNDTIPRYKVNPHAINAYSGVRATTHDRLPMVGPVPDSDRCNEVYADIRHGRSLDRYPPLPVHRGLYAIAGLGSRGIVTAPFAASLLSDFILGGQSISEWMPLINPARFIVRQLKRSGEKA